MLYDRVQKTQYNLVFAASSNVQFNTHASYRGRISNTFANRFGQLDVF